jgi:hypothetical protein
MSSTLIFFYSVKFYSNLIKEAPQYFGQKLTNNITNFYSQKYICIDWIFTISKS